MVAKKKNTPHSKSVHLSNDSQTKNQVTKPRLKNENLENSVSLSSLGVVHPKDLKPLPHQIHALERAVNNLKNNQAFYLAADAGLGKTIVAAMVANVFLDHQIYYLCPPFLESNTENEFQKWCFKADRLTTLPDSMLAKRAPLWAQMITNTVGKKILIVDEAHRFKNERSKRTKALLKIIPLFKGKVMYMSGTPMPNARAIELWPILKASAPNIFGSNFFEYGLKYCGGVQGPWGWEFNSFTNRKEFSARIKKSFLLRQRKELLDLPPKLEGLLVVGDDLPKEVSGLERKIVKAMGYEKEEDAFYEEIKEVRGGEDLHLATYLRLLGDYKLNHALPFIKALLEETKENVLLFCVHKETISRLAKELRDFSPLVITGDIDKKKRQNIVDTFQTSEEHRVFIGNIQACGVGFTLTKATRVIFIEFSWVDGDNSQASDRAHRIGQHQSVQVQYVVLKGSIDHKRMAVVLRKRELSI